MKEKYLSSINHKIFLVYLLLATSLLISCRGYITDKRPVHLNPNMDVQSKFLAQKLPLDVPQGTVPWGESSIMTTPTDKSKFLKEDAPFYYGRTAENGPFIEHIPRSVNVDLAFIERGRERYNIYCATCHDRSGSGMSMVVKRGMVQPVDLIDPRLRNAPDGELFNVISKGIRNMPAYAKKISAKDRWTIIAYLRALQIARNSNLNDLPSDVRQILLREKQTQKQKQEQTQTQKQKANAQQEKQTSQTNSTNDPK